MQFVVKRDVLLRSLNFVQGIVEKKNTLPILSNVLLELKNNCLSILTSNIFNIKSMDNNKVRDILAKAEKEAQNQNVSDQAKYFIDHKIEVLKSIN